MDMRIDYQHNLAQEKTYQRISNLLLDLQRKYAGEIKNPESSWNSEHTRMDYSVEIMGFKVNWQITLKNGLVSLEGEIPFMARIFSEEIEKGVRKKLEEILS